MKRVLLAAVSVGLVAAGFVAGRWSAKSSDNAVETGGQSTEIHTAQSNISASVQATSAASGPESYKSAEPVSGWDEQRWKRLSAQPATPGRNLAMAQMLERLAAIDPKRAMAMAQAEGNLKFREELVHAALRGWGGVAPMDALNWALALTKPSEREAAVATAFAGAIAANSEEAMRAGKRLIAQDPNNAVEYGARLIDSLSDAGKFEGAAEFAVGGESVQRESWMGLAYSRWAALQPEEAAKAASELADPEARKQALHGVVGGWAQAEPAALTQFLTQLPSGGDRGVMLGQALRSWVNLDPEAASRWINSSEMGPDLDEGVASVATLDSVNPELAINWAESITDEKLRSATLQDVLRNWVTTDFPAAKHFFDTTSHLQPPDRKVVGEIIADITKPAPSQ
jgi:hypothetical protein